MNEPDSRRSASSAERLGPYTNRAKRVKRLGSRSCCVFQFFCGCGNTRSPPMRFRGLLAAAVAVGLVGLTGINTAEAGLFGNYGFGRSSSCCGSSDAWNGCATTSCDSCCDTSSCCGGHGLFGKWFGGRGASSCCHAEPTCGCAPEPTCGCEVVEPTCGCAPEPCCEPAGCGGGRRGGFLRNLFNCHRSSCCEPSCDYEPTCGCEPTRGY